MKKIPLEHFRLLRKHVFSPGSARHNRNLRVIQIELTWLCNLHCFNCDRSCRQAPTREYLAIEQLERFLTESIENGVRWKELRLLGGEPTLHPEFNQVIDKLRNYRDSHSPDTQIELRTNGHGDKVKSLIKALPSDIFVNNSAKESVVQAFKPFNLAPCDQYYSFFFDYSNGCEITNRCGTSFGPYGFYPCGVAAGIDRIFGFNLGRKSLPDDNDEMRDLMQVFCALCGHFSNKRVITTKEKFSKSWRMAYKKWHQKKPVLTRY